MDTNDVKRILFFVNDFKTDRWGAELKKFNYRILPREHRFFSHISIIIHGYFRHKRIHAFIFRYLNDHKSPYESILYFFRDILIISLCKVLRVKILWILHNIDRETQENFPSLIHLRRKLIYFASKKVLVTDPILVEVAQKYGINKKKLSWLCFGRTIDEPPDQKNIDLKVQISAFKKQLQSNGILKVYLGLCVSKPSEKKLHYILANSIVGSSEELKSSIVGLVLIGKFPKGAEFDSAKQRALQSPYILFIDKSFEVNEAYISNQIDFFYRSLTDQSVPFTLYIAADVRKPTITHNRGALPLILKKERLGCTLDQNEKDIPGKIADYVDSWTANGADDFLKNRTWTIAAQQLIMAIEE